MFARSVASAALVALLLAVVPTLAHEYAQHHTARRLAPALTRRGSGQKYVFAHVVQGDFQKYSAQDWSDDITLAKAAGIDAFALNVGHDATDAAQMKLAFAAAESDGQFKLFFSFDGTYFNTAAAAADILPVYITPFANSSAYFTYESKKFVSTFAGDATGTFLGNTTSLDATAAAWQAIIASAASQSPAINIYFSPNWNDPADVSEGGLSGIMSWTNAWPSGSGNITTDVDSSYITAASGRGLTYIAPVSPFFYVHVSDANNRILRSDDWLLPTHYEQLINLAAGPDFIELISWNDFGESHYLGPLRSDDSVPAMAGNYTNADFDHTPMLTLSSYYNSWFKNGTAPTIGSETIVWWYRPHGKNAVATADSLAAPANTNVTDDNIYAAVLVPAKSKATTLRVYTGGSSASQTVSQGVNLLRFPFEAGSTSIELSDKKGNVLLSGNGTAIVSSPVMTYNFNYHSYIVPQNATPASIITTSTTTKSGGTRLSMSLGGALLALAASAALL